VPAATESAATARTARARAASRPNKKYSSKKCKKERNKANVSHIGMPEISGFLAFRFLKNNYGFLIEKKNFRASLLLSQKNEGVNQGIVYRLP